MAINSFYLLPNYQNYQKLAMASFCSFLGHFWPFSANFGQFFCNFRLFLTIPHTYIHFSPFLCNLEPFFGREILAFLPFLGHFHPFYGDHANKLQKNLLQNICRCKKRWIKSLNSSKIIEQTLHTKRSHLTGEGRQASMVVGQRGREVGFENSSCIFLWGKYPKSLQNIL